MRYLLLLCLTGCLTNSKPDALPPDPFHPKIYAASHLMGGLVRKQDNEVISCAEKEFSKYACISYLELIELQMLINKCEQAHNE